MRKVGTAAVFLLLHAVTGFASTPYLGLDPGWAKQVDVAKVLGEPQLKIADVLHEHKPQDGTGAIFVEYRLGSDVVDRIEVKLKSPTDRAAIIEAMRLSPSPVASSVGSSGALVEYFGEGTAIGLTYAAGQNTSGVTSISYNSDRLFESEVARAKSVTTTETATAPAAPTSPDPQTPPAAANIGNTVPPSVKRDPAACYDLFLWADAQEVIARRAKQVVRRQKAMDIRIAAQSGDCDRARQLAGQYKQTFRTP
jgi:hypothetical protein